MSGPAVRGRQGRAVEVLGRAVVGGRYRPGDLLPTEDGLCAELGVSRTTVRGAVAVLGAKGLLKVRPRVGTRVQPRALWNTFDPDILVWAHAEGDEAGLVESFVALRQVLEPAAARVAAGRASMADLEPLRRAVATMTASVDEPGSYPDADVAFHQALYAATHNAYFERFGMLVGEFMRIAFQIQQSAAVPATSLAADAGRHVAVYEAIRRGDCDGAAAAMLEVVLDGKTELSAAFAQRAADEGRQR
ncbi:MULTISPECIES: FadR/GntR family transcriptional regulator [unclassified Streptomyces]|uniref:FadR/GntR family transcriptional regulator n=1 Tax=unclassified Streptomyces TaxID=2593676 RepID=UPI0036E02B0C